MSPGQPTSSPQLLSGDEIVTGWGALPARIKICVLYFPFLNARRYPKAIDAQRDDDEKEPPEPEPEKAKAGSGEDKTLSVGERVFGAPPLKQ